MSSSKVAPAAEENNSGGSSSSRRPVSETLRLSRLQKSEYHLDVGDVDDGSSSDESNNLQSLEDIHFKRGEKETIKKGKMDVLQCNI